jgi:hypothetical protein
MDSVWKSEFDNRMRRFARSRRTSGGTGWPVSIKVRVTSGCFHREHSPRAYHLIDASFSKHSDSSDFDYLEHESGPELLVYLAVATAGVTLVKSVIDLIITIIKSRSEGVKKGDKPSDPLELIVRHVDEERKFREEIILRIGSSDAIDAMAIETQLKDALRKIGQKSGENER